MVGMLSQAYEVKTRTFCHLPQANIPGFVCLAEFRSCFADFVRQPLPLHNLHTENDFGLEKPTPS